MYKSLLTLSFDVCNEKPLMNMQNRTGPCTEPWGTPNFTGPSDDDSLLTKKVSCLLDRIEKR